jgi:hypothetical protein
MNSAENQHFAAIRLAQPARTRSGEMVSHTVARATTAVRPRSCGWFLSANLLRQKGLTRQ